MNSPDKDYVLMFRNLSLCLADPFDWVFPKKGGLKTYWNNVTGLDVVEFCRVAVDPHCREDESNYQAFARVYGEMAANLIKLLLAYPDQIEEYLASDEAKLPVRQKYELFKSGKLTFGGLYDAAQAQV